ncbi:MAG: purine-nucleoside phosphorylase [Pirellulales bacterium]
MQTLFETTHDQRRAAGDATSPRRRWADARPHNAAALAAAVATIKSRWRDSRRIDTAPVPQVAIILGTGLGGVAAALRVDAELPYTDLPPFLPSTAIGHRGALLLAHLNGVPVLAFSGRTHLYEGHGLRQVTLPVDVSAALGAGVLIASNASGGLNPTYRAGDVVVVDDHIDFTFSTPRPRLTNNGQRDDVYDRELIEIAHRSARQHGGSSHRGVYAAVPGPNYETRAEIRMLRRVGADVVGMSTVPEVVAARSTSMRVAALSVVTNVCTPDRAVAVTGSAVAESASRDEALLAQIVGDLITYVGADGTSGRLSP